MEIIIAVVVIAAIGYFFFKGLDTNKDGKVTLEEVKATADVNNDGKVNVEDVKVAATKAKTAVKKTASNVGAKTKAAMKKATTAKKPATKKAAK